MMPILRPINMRIRYPFAGAFGVILLISAFIGLKPHNVGTGGTRIPPALQPNDKLLHFVNFLLLSLAFYWILDTTRRRTLNLTIMVCTMGLGIGSEVLQAILPNGRSFDPFDVLANIVGSLCAVGLCTWYHKRMMDRRRKARFGSVGGDGAGEDVELGTRDDGLGPQESGVTSLEQEVDNWDENAVDDWDGEEEGNAATGPGPSREIQKAQVDGGDIGDAKKRSD